MGREPCRSKDAGLKRCAWTAEEDMILREYVTIHGNGGWNSLPQKAGLNRRGKSCRLRWFNYLRPNIKHGNISSDEDDLIIRLHRLLGNRWSLIAARLPGRTDNEIKNHWNTYLSKRVSHKHRKSVSKSAVPLVGEPLLKPTPVRLAKSCTNNVVQCISNIQDVASTDAINTVKDLKVWSDLESLCSEIRGHPPTSQLDLLNLHADEHSHSADLWCWD